MSEENGEIMRALYERWGEGDFSGVTDLFDPHVVLVMGQGFLDAGAYHGVDAIAAWFRGLLEHWTHLTLEAEEIIAAGDSVLVAATMRGAGSTSGIAMEGRYFWLWSFRGRKVVRIEVFAERIDALEAAGLSE